MDSSELMFLFEISVDELKSFSHAKNYKLRARFGDVFTLHLEDPNQIVADAIVRRNSRKSKRALKIRNGRVLSPTRSESTSQIAVVVSDVESLIRSMLNFPIELTHYSKDEPFVLGMVEIPWTKPYIDYLKNLSVNPHQPPVLSRETYKTYDEYTSKRVAVITVTISLSQLKDNFALTTQIRTKCDVHNDDLPVEHNWTNEIGTIKTIYSGGKIDSRKKHKINEKVLISQNNDVNVIDVVPKNANDTLIPKSAQECDKIIINEVGNNYNLKSAQEYQITRNDSDNNTDQESKDIVKDEADNVLFSRLMHISNDIFFDTIKSSDAKIAHDFNEIFNNEANHICQDIANFKQKESISLYKNSSKSSRVSLIRSQINIKDSTDLSSIQSISKNSKHWSSTAIEIKERLDTLNYIFGNIDGPFGNRVYCVEYFTVEKDLARSRKTSSANTPTKTGTPAETPTKSPDKTPSKSPDKSPAKTPNTTPSEPGTPKSKVVKMEQKNFPMNICGSKCIFGGPKNPCFENVCELDLPEKAPEIISVTKCTHSICDYRKKAASLTEPFSDEIPILVDFGKSQTIKDCCAKEVKEVEVFSGMTANLLQEPCSCTCECTFGFITKTTYCNICGGFEVPGDEMKSTRGGAPFPCPIYHGWQAKGKKGLSKKSSGTADDSFKGGKGSKSDKKSIESERDALKTKTKKKRKRDPRFKFNYGYKGIPPQIGHSQCIMPCTGDLYPVPKHMGWLWTANNIPGLKVRPNWRPGAANKHVVRMLRMARFPDEILNKRRRKDTGKKKRPLKRPLLVVQKKDGEYNVTMETMKTFTKPRAVNQYPYEDKPLVQYTIGRTDEENAERKKRKERAQRRLEREQRAFLQSAFHDMCKEICLKTYQQALGMLPFGEDSWCPCYPEDPAPDRIDESHSCSCTESTRSSGSMTDDDEWVIEFTPPNAYFNPTREVKKINQIDSETQYTYLDYKVKLFDRHGNPVPRFFTGPDGKEECSDLGGFWGPKKKWLEINVDGYIAPDGRWAPNNFVGPCGEYVDGEAGNFMTSNGVSLTVGVDGYVDVNNKWHFYNKPKTGTKDNKFQRNVETWKKAGGCIEEGEGQKIIKHKRHKSGYDHHRGMQSETMFSCFGDASPHTLSQMGIAGHGHDRRLLLSTLEQLLKQGENVKIPYRPNVPKMSLKHRKNKQPKHTEFSSPDKIKYKNRQPSTKGIMAVNDRGHKTYFQLKQNANPRAKQRIKKLGEEGISLSSFHVPCFSSFINSEVARQQQLQHILQHNARLQNSGMQTS